MVIQEDFFSFSGVQTDPIVYLNVFAMDGKYGKVYHL